MILTTDSKERVTFKVNVDEEGDVTKLTYSHNVTSRSAEAMTQYIRTAYNAIMSTDFEPAMKDGNPVADTVVIEFNIVG